MTSSSDFHKVENLKFDTKKLKRSTLEEVLKIRKYDRLMVLNFGAICLNQIQADLIQQLEIKLEEFWTKT